MEDCFDGIFQLNEAKNLPMSALGNTDRIYRSTESLLAKPCFLRVVFSR